MRIKDISLENRPRERMQREGVSVLSSSELLAIILQKGTRKENVIDMSNRLISKFGIEKLSKCTLSELKSISGASDNSKPYYYNTDHCSKKSPSSEQHPAEKPPSNSSTPWTMHLTTGKPRMIWTLRSSQISQR